jgi:hypothetical protein
MNRPIPLRPDPHALAAADRRSLIRALTCKALASVRDQGAGAGDILRRAWPDDAQAALIVKAAVSPTSTAGYPSITTATVLPALAPGSASARLFARCLQVDLAGVAKVRVPYISGAPQPGFVGEGSAAPVAQFSLSGTDVGPARKILILTAVTGELEGAAPETASVIIGKALSDATTKAVDAAVFSNIAADATRPAGLLTGVTPLAAATGGTDPLMAEDVGALAAAIADADIDASDMVIVASVPQAVKLRMLSSANFTNLVIGTNAVADGTVIGIAPSAVAVGYSGSPEIESSREAVVHFEDTTPLPIATGVQGSGVLATPTRSAFQTDMIVLRARCAWAALPGAVQLINNVGW